MTFAFQGGEDFEPSANTKKWWLYTHKTPSTVAGIRMPGLFQTTHYEWQLLGFILIFLLEGLATWQCKAEGVAITAILTTIFIDVALALFAHVFEAPICDVRNRLVWAPDADVGMLQRKLGKLRFWQRTFFFLIAVSAGFKIYWFWSVYQTIDAKAAFIATCYLLGAILHISCTGFAVFTTIHEFKIQREHNRYLDSARASYKFKPEELMTALKTQCDSVTSTQHARVAIVASGSELRTRGVMTDGALHWLIASQSSDEKKRALAIVGVHHQMLILLQDPDGLP